MACSEGGCDGPSLWQHTPSLHAHPPAQPLAGQGAPSPNSCRSGLEGERWGLLYLRAARANDEAVGLQTTMSMEAVSVPHPEDSVERGGTTK